MQQGTLKKIVEALFFVLAALIVVYLILHRPGLASPPNHYSYRMNGHVVTSTASSVVVSGMAQSSAPRSVYKEARTVAFAVTPQTVLKNMVLVISPAQAQSRTPLTPATKEVAGNVSDLAANVTVFRAQSDDNLFTADSAVATEIDYITYDFPAPSVQ